MLEQSIDEFVRVARQRDLFSEFVQWYQAKNVEDPASWPLLLSAAEWEDMFVEFLSGVELR